MKYLVFKYKYYKYRLLALYYLYKTRLKLSKNYMTFIKYSGKAFIIKDKYIYG